jgi:hypothetical protein
MGVTADDEVGPGVHGGVREFHLTRLRRGEVFSPPVRHHDE